MYFKFAFEKYEPAAFNLFNFWFCNFFRYSSASVLAQVEERPIQNNEHEVHPIETLPEQKKLRKKTW